MPFGQLVIGPPGSGKTTYCHGMQQFLTGIGRKVAVVNLDPANDLLPYSCTVDISTLITVSDVMENLKLGPNGGLIYCLEYLEKNIHWLLAELTKLKDHYFLFDCPGQIELYTHHESVRNIMRQLKEWNYRLASVHLVDSYYCCQPSLFISVVMTTLSTMLQIELPHISILSKIDLIEKHGRLALNLDFYTEVLDMSYLLDWLQEDVFLEKYKKLNAAFCEVIGNYSLVSFHTLDIQDNVSMLRVMKAADKANGYVFGDLEEHNLERMMSSAMGADFEWSKIGDVRTKYLVQEDQKQS